MRLFSVVPLQDYLESAREAGVAESDIRSIVTEIQTRPFHGHCVAPLYSEIGTLPMGGFYARTDRVVVRGKRHEGHSLTLYLSNILPVYVFRFSLEPLAQLPWNNPDHLAFLVQTGRALHTDLMSLET